MTRQVRAGSSARPPLPAPGGGAAARAAPRPAPPAQRSPARPPALQAPGPLPAPPASAAPRWPASPATRTPGRALGPRPESHAQQAPTGQPDRPGPPEARPSLWRRGARRRPLGAGARPRGRPPPRSPLPGGPLAPTGARCSGRVAAPALESSAPDPRDPRGRTSAGDGAGRGRGLSLPDGDIRFRGHGRGTEGLGGAAGQRSVSQSESPAPGKPAFPALLSRFSAHHAGASELAAHPDGLQGAEAG